jgi:protein TonB
MFDKLIESDSHSGQSNNRGRYFSVSALAMSVFLFSGVIVSIYGAEFDIGTSNLELAQLIAPVAPTEPQPDPPQQSPQQKQSVVQSSELPTRQAAVQNITEVPNKILPVSSVPSQFRPRPDYGNFKLGSTDTDLPPGTGKTQSSGTGLTPDGPPDDTDSSISKIPPPVIPKSEPKKSSTIVSLGVVNGKATSLPPPPYPAAAKAIGANGAVSVQIMIDVDGKVISSKAVSGHPLLKKAAEDAARRARFSPTFLSKEPVKVTGFITYNFKI